MKRRTGANRIQSGQPARISLLCICVAILLAAGCGVPSEPVPPSPPIPNPVTDLAATQLGDGVLLTFTLPTKSTRSERLTATPTLEIWRGTVRPNGLPDPHSLHLVDTVPGALLTAYIQDGKVQFPEHYSAQETREHPGEIVVLSVRTRVSERKSSADSNFAVLSLYPVSAPVENVQAHVTEKSIDLTWEPPTKTSAGEPIAPPITYYVFRGELDPASIPAAEKDLHATTWKSLLMQIATTTAPEYQDAGFDWGKTYVYVVRSAIKVNGVLLQSGDSRPVILTPKDTFPPAAPQDLVAAVLPGVQPGTSIVDLSWGINVETDLAGYHVYRSERENERGQLLTPKLLPSSAYRDSDAVSGHRYWYTVTAVDNAGNESALSAPMLVEVP